MPEDRRLEALMLACRSFNKGGFSNIVGYTAMIGSNKGQAIPPSGTNPNIYKILINSSYRFLEKETVIGSLIYGMIKVVNSLAH